MHIPKRDPFNEGYYLIPNNTQFSVTRSGGVLDRVSGELLEKSFDGDLQVYLLVTPNGCKPLPSLPRVLAEVFIEQDVALLQMLSIHKRVGYVDSDPFNVYLDNLKWVVTDAGEVQYKEAKKSVSKVRSVLSKNLDTGDITTHTSISALARHFNKSPEVIGKYITSAPLNTVYVINNQIFKMNNTDTWPDLSTVLLVDKTNEKKGPCIVPCKFIPYKGDVIEFSSMSKAAKFAGIAPTWFRTLMASDGKVTTPIGVYVRR